MRRVAGTEISTGPHCKGRFSMVEQRGADVLALRGLMPRFDIACRGANHEASADAKHDQGSRQRCRGLAAPAARPAAARLHTASLGRQRQTDVTLAHRLMPALCDAALCDAALCDAADC